MFPIMGVDSDQDDIQLERCQDLVIKIDTPKGENLQLGTKLSCYVCANKIVGRGVFATKDIPARTIIDICPVLILGTEENKQHIEKTSLYHYT
jgi:hypothetical protein